MPNENKAVIKINLFGLCENAKFPWQLIMQFSRYPYNSSISSLNTLHGTKLKLKLNSLIGQISKCSNCMFITISKNNRNEREIAENLSGEYLQNYLYLSCLLSVATELGTELMLRNGTFS